MPVRTGKDSKGCFARFGQSGKKYYYKCGNTQARNRAKQRAHVQGSVISDKTGKTYESEKENCECTVHDIVMRRINKLIS